MNDSTNHLITASGLPREEDALAAYGRLIEVLQDVATPDDVITMQQGELGAATILDAARIRIRKFLRLDKLAFLLTDEGGLEFVPVYHEPEDWRAQLMRWVGKWVDDGIFSWALSQNRAVVQHGESTASVRILHVIATRSGALGMFIGVLEEGAPLDEADLALLSVVLQSCANSLEAHALHRELQHHNRDLEILVQDRTRELETAKQEAERAAQSKGAFLATMSHELRTPMNGVLGMAQLLLGAGLNATQEHYAQTLLRSGRALLEILNDILDFSKIEAGKLDMEDESFDLVQLLDEVEELFRTQAERKGLMLEVCHDARCPRWVQGDPGRIRQVFLNLVGNAIKFTAKGSVRVQVSDHGSDLTTARLRCVVEDTGLGIDPVVQKNLFQPFTQADVSTTRKFGGTGLGLAICQQLVSLMNGEIGVKSEPRKGSEFWFTLQLPLAQPMEKQGGSERYNVEDARKFHGNVLLVEDNPVNQLVAEAMLDNLGLKVELAGDGQAAVQLWKDHDYDLVLMDCQMPVMDGFQATAAIRGQETADVHIPIVALTANAMAGDRDRCLAAGMDAFLSKPINQVELMQILADYLPDHDTAAGQAAAAVTHEELPQQATPALLNMARWTLLQETTGDLFGKIVTAFVEGMGIKLDDVKHAVDARDASHLHKSAHALQGSAAHIGADLLREYAKALEIMGRTDSMEGADDAYQRLQDCCAETLRALQRAQQQGSTESDPLSPNKR